LTVPAHSSHKTLGQEFYFDETIVALAVVDPQANAREQIRAIAAALPHRSAKTRQRLAEKIHQRYSPSAPDEAPVPFIALIKALPSRKVRRELLVYQLARVDTLVAGLAEEIFWPFFVGQSLPRGYSEGAFRRANTGTLIDTDRFISTRFCHHYAQRQWRFESRASIGVALRILRDARILDSAYVRVGDRRMLGWIPTFRGISSATFVYTLLAEFGDGLGAGVQLDRVQNSRCARLFLLSPVAVDSLVESARRLVGATVTGRGSSRGLALPPLSPADRADQLLRLASGED
jgi:hypothetical protein